VTLLSSCPFFLMKDDISSSQLRMESGKKVGELLPAETEEEIFEALGIAYRPPEDRETPL